MSIELESFTLGFVLAFGLILPLGPQNLFVLTHAARSGKFLQTIPVFMTSALCDTLLIGASTLGLSLVFLKTHYLLTVLRVIGILFLAYIGWSSWHEPETTVKMTDLQHGMKRNVLTILALSLLNPHAIIDTMVIIGATYFAIETAGRSYFVLACMLVSWLWFLLLAITGIHLAKFEFINKYQGKVSALVMWSVAAYLGYQLWQ